jgi:nitrate/TMAO reductase-like tetraheme cytochrome c subunit
MMERSERPAGRAGQKGRSSMSLWDRLRTPSSRHALGSLVLLGIVLGATGLASVEYTFHALDSDAFCLSCHELQENIGIVYQTTVHARNATGFVVGCADCHVPKPLGPKLLRKTQGLREFYHHLRGTIDTPAKFEAHRLEMAQRVWTYMESVDSRECRDCHQSGRFDLEAQSERAREFHEAALSKDETCIDCHKGIAHSLPEGITPNGEPPTAESKR